VTTDTGRPLRADARRNRKKILSAAVRVFAEEGLEGAHLERIAKEAGVGSGTLYRNFPTREALIEAAYRNELSRLCEAASELLAAMPDCRSRGSWRTRRPARTLGYAAWSSTPFGSGRQEIHLNDRSRHKDRASHG
jgi:AcrR family transcriptional regulator